MEYRVDLDIFRGPLDLLLYLVKRQEVDICDIPIARVAEQFLEYLGILEMVDVERAGDFLVMAATLMEIKSRMLLPRGESALETEADPRLELVRQLIEYKKFKDAALLLEAQAERQLSRIPRLPLERPGERNLTEEPLRHVELWDLVSAFGRLMRETLAQQPQQIFVDQTPLHIHMDIVLARLHESVRLPLSEIFTPPHSRSRLVGLFLAILELIRTHRIEAEQPEEFGEIWLSAVVEPADTSEPAAGADAPE
jgi:segregation and condensation protein A